MRDYGLFIQDDWRVTPRLVLNLGLRYDFYGKSRVNPTADNPVGFYNLAPPTDWKTFNFGPPRDPKDPYNNDKWVNMGPRAGFAYTVDRAAKTVVRGGFGILFSSQMPGVVRQGVADPVVPFRVTWSLAEARDLGLTYPKYNDQMRTVVQQQNARTGIQFPVLRDQPRLPESLRDALPVQRPEGADVIADDRNRIRRCARR
ncbi:MAG: TonB-dependent receptor [Bryobacteraceae bacterium]